MAHGTIRMTPEEVQSAARLFKSKSEEGRNTINQLTNTWGRVKQGWEGKTANDVDQKMNEWKKNMQEYVTVLAHIGQRLDELAKEFHEFDNKTRAL